MTITQIKYFLAAARSCNFTKASKELYITQQALSRHIKALETEIGFPLFKRRKQRVILTEAGAHMQKVWEVLIAQTEQALGEASQMAQGSKVRIGLPDVHAIIDRLLPITEVDSNASVIENAEFIIDSVSSLIRQFEQKEIDMLIMFHVDILHLEKTLYLERLQELEYGVICSNTHPVSKLPHLQLTDLSQETLLLFDDFYAKDAGLRPIEECEKAGFTPKKILSFHDWKNMELALYQRKGIALTYGAFLPAYRKELVFIPIEFSDKSQPNELVIAWRDDAYRSYGEEIVKLYRSKD